MRLAIVTATAGADSLKDAVNSWVSEELLTTSELVIPYYAHFTDTQPPLFLINGRRGMLRSYAFGFNVLCGDKSFNAGSKDYYDILAFLHDDLIIHNKDWVDRVLREFEDPQVGLVGFGGATRHGSPELYKIEYDYHQLGRSNFLSNMDDAENHGKRFTGACDVAVLDGFALIVRRDVLKRANGWPLSTPINYIAYDYWLCCMMRRLGYRIRLVGVSCNHLGGRTYVKLGIGDKPDHWEKYLAAHQYIYDEFKDCLPYEVRS